MFNVKVKYTGPYRLEKGTPNSAAYDLKACLGWQGDWITMLPNTTLKVATGIYLDMGSADIAAQILPRSGLGSSGLVLANTVGLIDPDYQGELIVNLLNRSNEARQITEGMKVAQLFFFELPPIILEEVEEFGNITVRGEGSFGSTGL